MGRWGYSNRQEVEESLKIHITWLRRNGWLDKGCWRQGNISWTNSNSNINIITDLSSEADFEYINLIYTQTDRDTGGKKDFDYKVRLATTPCYFGGVRYWFICPLTVNGKYCGRRVGVIYKGGDYFGCRHCYNLTYDSKKLNRNSKFHPLFSVLTLDKKIEDLREQMKRRTYAGKPTKKQMRIDRLENKVFQYGYKAHLF